YNKYSSRKTRYKHLQDLWENVWSQKPIELVVEKDGVKRTITAQFEPGYDESNQIHTDLGKVIRNKNGSSGDRTVTINISDDLYDIASNSKYMESGIDKKPTQKRHEDIKEWHYFANDFVYRDEDGDRDMSLRLEIKERPNGNF